MFNASIESNNIDLATGADTTPPYWTTLFGLFIATYTTTLGSSAGKNPMNDNI